MEYRGELVANGVTIPIYVSQNGVSSKRLGLNYTQSTRPNQVVRDIIRRTSIPLSVHAVFVINKEGDVWQYVGQMRNGQSIGRLEKLDVVLAHSHVMQAFSGVTPIIDLLRR